MTSTSDRMDDDVIVITGDDIVDEPRHGAHEGPAADDRDDVADGDLAQNDTATEPVAESSAPRGHAGSHTEDGGLGEGESGDDPVMNNDARDDDAAGDDAADDEDAGRTASGAFAMPSAGPDDAVTPDADAGAGDAATARADAAAGERVAIPDEAADAVSGPDDDWPQIQAMFVDDPRRAVESAAAVSSAALAALVATARDRDQALRQEWQGDGTGTEELRTALRQYRALTGQLKGLAGQL